MAAASVAPNPLSPAPPAQPGIALALAPRRLPDDPLVVHGAFRLSEAEAAALGDAVHRAVVLLVQHGPTPNVYVPFREQVLFGDDVTAADDGVEGYFNLDVFALQGGLAPGRYHLLVSMGERRSAVLETVIE